MTITLNVNLKPCTCPTGWPANGGHFPRFSGTMGCDASPILIPCPIPRSVTFSVALGECTGSECYSPIADVSRLDHGPRCPARSVCVSCSISGKTWAESEVTDTEVPAETPFMSNWTAQARERWTLIKALVTGRGDAQWKTNATVKLVEQRDAVYAALADMARHEAGAFEAEQRATLAIDPDFRAEPPKTRPSELLLQRYVEHLIEQVGVL